MHTAQLQIKLSHSEFLQSFKFRCSFLPVGPNFWQRAEDKANAFANTDKANAEDAMEMFNGKFLNGKVNWIALQKSVNGLFPACEN